MAGEGTTADAWVHRLARGLGAQVLETPISWVLLARDLAFKLKKPVRLPFVDYSTPARRKFFCEEEVRLNRRLAPALYLGVSRMTAAARSRPSTGRARPSTTRCACGAFRRARSSANGLPPAP